MGGMQMLSGSWVVGRIEVGCDLGAVHTVVRANTRTIKCAVLLLVLLEILVN